MSALSQSRERAIPPATPSPSLHHLLHSNDPPIESEHGVASGIISTAERRLADVEEEMRRLEDALDQLRVKHDDLRMIIDSHKAIISPVRRLPRELVAEIALHTLWFENDDSNKEFADWPVAATLDSHSSPWKLGQLCRFWRDVVLSFPELWSSVRIHNYHHKSSNLEDALNTLLQRSTDLPLSIDFVDRHNKPQISARLLKILVGHCHRWKNVKLALDLCESFDQLASVRERLPVLEQLRWYPSRSIVDAYFRNSGVSAEEDSAVHLANNPFAVAPNLRSFTHLSVGYSRMSMSLPLSQLQHYDGRDFDCSKVLPQLFNVVDCVLLGTSTEDASVAIELPFLRTLRACTSKLDFLATPAIEALDLDASCVGLRLLNDFLARSSCHALKSLSITGAWELDFIDALQLIPSLSSLRLWDVIYDSRLIRSLIFDATCQPLLPKLETLTMLADADPGFGQPLNTYFDEEILFQMIESRWNIVESTHSVTRLTKFLFSMPRTPNSLSANSLERRDEWQAQGLHLVVDVGYFSEVHGDLDRELRENWPFDSPTS